MAPEGDNFRLSGPSHLTAIDWKIVHHRRSVAASLVQGVYVLERDRQKKREGPKALASPWWEFFNFQMVGQLIDDDDSSIFGAIYKFKPQASQRNLSTDGCPRYVIAFRGTLFKLKSLKRDLELDFYIIRNELHLTSRFKIAMRAVRDTVVSVGSSNVWLAGHSLGSAIALLAGKTMAKKGYYLESFLFNSPFPSPPIESIKNKKVKHGIRIVVSVSTAALALFKKKKSGDPSLALPEWTPCLFVSPADLICSEYVGYFKHKKMMVEFGVGCIERLATQLSLRGLFTGKELEPMHRIPSANLTVNLTPSWGFKQAHGINQWWRPDLYMESVRY